MSLVRKITMLFVALSVINLLMWGWHIFFASQDQTHSQSLLATYQVADYATFLADIEQEPYPLLAKEHAFALIRYEQFAEAIPLLQPLHDTADIPYSLLIKTLGLHLHEEFSAAALVAAHVQTIDQDTMSILLSLVGRGYYFLRQYADALTVLENAQVRDPTSPLILKYLGLTAFATKKTALALESFTALDHLAPALVDAPVLMARGILHYRSGEYTGAVARFSQAQQLAKQDPKMYLYLYRIAQHNGLTQQAAQFIQTAMQLSPDDPQVIAEQGRFQLESKQYDAAKTSFDRAYALDATKIDVLIDSMYLAYMVGATREQKNLMTKITYALPHDIHLYTYLGYRLRQMHEYTTALQYLQKALSINADHTPAHDLLMQILIEPVSQALASGEDTTASINHLLALGGNDPLVHQRQSLTLAVQGDLPGAVRVLQEIDPQLSEMTVYTMLAWLYIYQHRYDKVATLLTSIPVQRRGELEYIRLQWIVAQGKGDASQASKLQQLLLQKIPDISNRDLFVAAQEYFETVHTMFAPLYQPEPFIAGWE